jgi:hypothetical protein
MLENIETGNVANTSAEVVDSGTPSDVGSDDSNVTLDDLLAMTKEDVPEFDDSVNHKGMKPLNHWMKHIPEDVRKHLANIRADYTRKTQELSKMKSSLEEKEAEIFRKNNHIINGPLAEKLKGINLEEQYDLFDPEGMKAEIQRQAGLMLKEMLKPAQEQLEVQQRKLELEAFKAKNPELTQPEYKLPIIELLKSRPELKMEDAFYIVKAKVDSEKLSAEKEKLKSAKASAKEIALKSTSGSRTSPTGHPQFSSAIEAYKYHKAREAKK